MTGPEEAWWEEDGLSPPSPLARLTGPAFDESESLRILGLVSIAVSQLVDQPAEKEFTTPYGPEAQMAVDRICLAGLHRFSADLPEGEQRYPRSLIDLLAWCRDRDVQHWHFLDVPADLALEGKLLDPDSGMPSALCQELRFRYRHPDPAGRSVLDLVLEHVRDSFAEAESPKGWDAFMSKLVTHPVLPAADVARLKISRSGVPESVVAACYIPVHARYYDKQDRANVCASCGLLRVIVNERWRCEIETCPDRRLSRGGRDLDRADGLFHAIRPLREFLIAPRRIRKSQRESFMAPDPPRDVESR